MGRRDISRACAPAVARIAPAAEGASWRPAAARPDRVAIRRILGNRPAPAVCLRGGVARLSVQVRVLPLSPRQDGLALSAGPRAGGAWLGFAARCASLQVRRSNVQPQGRIERAFPAVLPGPYSRDAG